jgi:hypothetical protein
VLSLGAKPRGLKPGNNILLLFQKDMCILCFILSFGKRGRTTLMRASGMHAVPWVTSVNPDTCE